MSDILAGQGGDEALLAELYDLEHDEISEDLAFYRDWASRQGDGVIDLGCGSGRLFASFMAGGASRVVGLDGSAALLRRAEARVEADAVLRAARDDGRIELVHGDVRRVSRSDRFALAIMAGVLAHLDGPEQAVRALASARRLLAPNGVLLLDVLGPGGLPERDLPLSVDWERQMGDRRVVRRSRIERREAPEGLRVLYATLTDLTAADGTIARLPASFRLWYPSASVLIALAGEAQLMVEAAFGSHEREPLGEESERCILVLRSVEDGSVKG